MVAFKQPGTFDPFGEHRRAMLECDSCRKMAKERKRGREKCCKIYEDLQLWGKAIRPRVYSSRWEIVDDTHDANFLSLIHTLRIFLKPLRFLHVSFFIPVFLFFCAFGVKKRMFKAIYHVTIFSILLPDQELIRQATTEGLAFFFNTSIFCLDGNWWLWNNGKSVMFINIRNWLCPRLRQRREVPRLIELSNYQQLLFINLCKAQKTLQRKRWKLWEINSDIYFHAQNQILTRITKFSNYSRKKLFL